MKQHLTFAGILLVLLLVLPIIGAGKFGEPQKDTAEKPAVTQQAESTSAAAEKTTEPTTSPAVTEAAESTQEPEPGNLPASVSVRRTSSGKVESIPTKEYIKGVVAGEMSVGNQIEAIKAQVVASATYAMYRTAVKGAAELTDTGASDQAYLSEAQRKAKWGDNFDTYEKTLEKAVDEVYGYILQYEGQPIFAAFHAISSGTTESAENYWDEKLPYLVSVASPGDKLAPTYTQTVALTKAEVEKALSDVKGLKLSSVDADKWFGEPERSEAGTVLKIEVGKGDMTGRELREALGLRSANFTVSYKSGSYTFTTKGYGHGVGMSQYGADFMARQGSDWKEILLHYYPGTEIV
ncbi:MAG: stage II sporulation protein D [Oscillospiraceae bacterium]|jgi:stage II sporulation protein D|nr:stage II sporulation protein D [Oscillospiraceae bacterium]